MKSIILKLFALCLIQILFSCTSPNNPSTTESKITISPGILSLTNKDEGYVWISLNTTTPFNWIVESLPSWIKALNESGSSNGNPVKLRFVGNLDLNVSQTLQGTIRINVPGTGIVNLNVVLAINDKPVLSINPTEINFYSNSTSSYFDIINKGGGVLNWKSANKGKNIYFSEDSGFVSSATSSRINVGVDKKSYKPGTYIEYATIKTDEDSINLKMTINVDIKVDLMTINSMNMNMFIKDTSFYIYNKGNVDLQCQIEDYPDIFTINPSKFTLSKGDSAKILVNINRTNLASGSYSDKIYINYNTGYQKIINLNYDNYKEEKTFIPYSVADVQFYKAYDYFILAVTNSNQLILMDFNGKVQKMINITYSPVKLSNVINDRIVVGHSGKLSLVNLKTLNVEKVVNVSCDPASVILTSNNWVYVSPTLGQQYISMKCINLSTGLETNSEQTIYAKDILVLHPSEKYIYSMTPNNSPQNFKKFDITQGTAKLLYSCPYHGDYPTGPNLWMDDVGTRIFTTTGNIFSTDENQSNDMVYSGNLGYTEISYLHQNTNFGKIAVAYNSLKNYYPDKAYLSIIDNNSFSLIRNFKIPDYCMPVSNGSEIKYKIYESICRYAFLSSDGKKALAILNPLDSNKPDARGNWAYFVEDL
jgi:hypothetical protein